MKLIKAILMLIGAVVVLGMGYVYIKLDPAALPTYGNMFAKVIETGDPAKGMIIKRKLIIEEGESKEEAIEEALEIMDAIGENYGLAKVDSKTMPRGGKFMKDGGLYTHIRSYCSPTIADIFLTHSGEFVGFMPCRVGIVEDKNGDIWLYTMSLDLMIHGGTQLPPELLKHANNVKEAMEAMITKGALRDED